MNTQDTGAEVIEFPGQKTMELQAAAWMVKLDDGEPSAETRQAFKEWVNQDPSHRSAFERVVAFSSDLNLLTQVVLPREKAISGPRFWGSGFAVACSLVLAVITVLVMPISDSQLYITQIGEQKTIQLDDRSIVLLNTNSQLEVEYSQEKRKLILLQGEAHFDVVKNPDRPFEVFAGKGLVRAVGTAFNVHLRKADVEVIVTEGVVELDQAEPQAATAAPVNDKTPPAEVSTPNKSLQKFAPGLQVKAGNRLTYDRDILAQVQLDDSAEISRALSWQQGILTFDGESLEQVVEEVSRYTELTIVIPERAARELKVGGLFKVGDTDALFEALKNAFGMRVKVVSKDVVYLISEENL